MYLLRLEQDDNVGLVRCDINNIPQYAVLSHTWLEDHEEVNFQDLQHTISPYHEDETRYRREHVVPDSIKKRPGYQKILFCGAQAGKNQLRYFWVDTCCIDKTSSAELAEAINSMFRWYQVAALCYVFLPDVFVCAANKSQNDDYPKEEWIDAFKQSRWFTRGWTLQELIAPKAVEFFSKDGKHLGNKQTLKLDLMERTGLPMAVIEGAPLSMFGVEERLSWAKGRQTKREEDAAYSLLGICNVYIPLIYGEGRESAMKRLKRSIYDSEEEAGRIQLSQARHRSTHGESNENTQESDDMMSETFASRGGQSGPVKRPRWHAQHLESGPTKEELQTLLKSLRFKQINTREMTIEVAHSKTCAWLLEKSEYLDWLDKDKLDDHHGILWIKGHPGTGKSTIMKYVLYQTTRTVESTGLKTSAKETAKPIVVAFFFNARGETLEKSTGGMYRSLLGQLLEMCPFLGPLFLRMVSYDAMVAKEGFEWDITLTQRMFETAVASIKEGVICFVDALDECDEEEVREMLRFFDHIRHIAASNGTEFRVCLASRHYPHISINTGIEMVLEGQEGHDQDINAYLESELRIGQGKTAKDIRTKVQKKASGIFMWVVLVVKLLNKEYDRGRVHALGRRLDEIPGDLHDLLRDILMRDTNNTDELILCIQWVLFTAFPLRPEQLYFAVLIGVDHDAPVEWDQDETDFHTIQRLILDSSKGLAEITKSIHPTVQFIHESVRDFLLKEESLGRLWPHLRNDFQKQSYDALFRSCFRYIGLSVLAQVKRNEELKRERPLDFNCMALPYFPFLAHAVTFVLQYGTLSTHCGFTKDTFTWDASERAGPFGNAFARSRMNALYIMADGAEPPALCFAYVASDGRKTFKAYQRSQDTASSPETVDIMHHDQDIHPYLVELAKEQILTAMLEAGIVDNK